MIDRRALITNGSAALFGALALSAVAGGGVAQASTDHIRPGLMPDPASTPVDNPPFPKNLTREERQHLETFDELDFDVFTHADWARYPTVLAPVETVIRAVQAVCLYSLRTPPRRGHRWMA
jgi:hypothetical protein